MKKKSVLISMMALAISSAPVLGQSSGSSSDAMTSDRTATGSSSADTTLSNSNRRTPASVGTNSSNQRRRNKMNSTDSQQPSMGTECAGKVATSGTECDVQIAE